jgi:purine-cytosine permease-like protein
MRLLEFVALWGMILMPMGAVILVDFWLLPRLGLKSNYSEAANGRMNYAAGFSWLVAVAACTWLVQTGRAQIYFVSLPGWFVTCLLYAALSRFQQRSLRQLL